MTDLSERIGEAVDFLEDKTDIRPELGLILGSGLGELGDEVEEAFSIGYEEIPGFLESKVEGHAGKLILGRLEGTSVYLMQGRYHYYEGHDISELVFPVQVMEAMGCSQMIVTNAAGAVNENFDVGEIALITDHINFLGNNPLIGENDSDVGPRFVDMTYAYDPRLKDLAREKAEDRGLDLREGVYVASMGPTYETPAEVKMYRTWGGDMAGMSTVPEVIAANHAGMRVLGLSCITNMAAGILDQPLDHEEVIEATERAKSKFKGLARDLIAYMPVD
ncbi:MAG: purine-nucleoside phosphorylase [bacterium]